MATESNNIQTNTFTGGMNSDSSYDLIKSDQYIFGLNIRITTNSLLSAMNDSNSSEGIVAPVRKGKVITPKLSDSTITTQHNSILATASIEDVGAVIMSYKNDNGTYKWVVYRVDFKEYKFYKEFESEEISADDFANIKEKFSVVINREVSAGNSNGVTDVVKLYIADGMHLIMQINLLDSTYNNSVNSYNGSYYKKTDFITSNRIYPHLLIGIVKLISGTLKTSLIQYTYRLYKKYGIVSKLAPLTSKILIIDNNRNKEEGNAENTTTSLGLQIKIPVNDLIYGYYNTKGFPHELFDHVQIFRLTYTKAQEDAIVDLIYDALITTNKNILINDDGIKSLLEYSIDEFSALDKLVIIPLNIEPNQNYLFASNIEDRTILRDAISNIDSKAYLRNKNGLYPVKNNTDITEEYRMYITVDDIPNNWDVNPGSIMTQDAEEDSNGKYTYYNDNLVLGGDGTNIDYKFITTDIVVHDGFDIYSLSRPYSTGNQPAANLKYITSDLKTILHYKKYNTSDYLNDHNISAINSLEYDDIITSSMLRSLRRDEVYRYGVIYYDKYGRRSDVQWIGDIKTPSYSEYPSFGNDYKGKELSSTIVPYTVYSVVNITDVNLDGTKYVEYFGPRILEADGQYSFYFTVHTQPVTCAADTSTIDRITLPIGKALKCSIKKIYINGLSIDEFIDKIFIDLYKMNRDDVFFEIPYDVYIMSNGEKYSSGEKVSGIGQNIDIFIEANLNFNDSSETIKNFKDYISKNNFNIINLDKFWSSDYNNIWLKLSALKNLALNAGGEFRTVNPWPKFEQLTYTQYTAIVTVDIELEYIDTEDFDSTRNLVSKPIGIEFNINVPKSSGIEHYLIVRCSKASEYSKTIMQCALSKPIRLNYSAVKTSTSLKSPYYPTPFLSTLKLSVKDYIGTTDTSNGWTLFDNNLLFQLHSSEISTFPEDSMSIIHKNDSRLSPLYFCYADYLEKILKAVNGFFDIVDDNNILAAKEGVIVFYRLYTRGANEDLGAVDFKSGATSNLYLYNYILDMIDYNGVSLDLHDVTIEDVSDVLVPTWEHGFSNVQLSGSKVVAAVKAYKSYVSSIKTEEYVNWVCNGMYNLRICDYESQAGLNDGEAYTDDRRTKVFTYADSDNSDSEKRSDRASGWVGPGSQCLLVKIPDTKNSVFSESITGYDLKKTGSSNIYDVTLGSLICNIRHTPLQFAGFSDQEKQFDIYYGFGNFGTLIEDPNDPTNMKGSIIVFDGDVYNLPCEQVSMYKTYNFNSIRDTIPSALFVNYVPLETKINTFFDYGMTYRNTQSANLQVEPGEITGVSSQDRPHHQYNPIYSDNNMSNDVYNALSEENSINKYTQRIFYSQLKTNGEAVDSWTDFRTLNYIDADTRYGEITNLLTDKDILYFWLVNAFGKLSVNERSLITDNNNNTIQLGQGGVLQRTDYIDTYYGMRRDDLSAINTNAGIFWIDILNKAILNYTKDKVVNYGEQVNVLNVINNRITSNGHPIIDYDVLNSELMCKCLKNEENDEDVDQLIFNTKYGCATGIYTRRYDDTIWYNNTIYGLYYTNGTEQMKLYNYLASDENMLYLTPTVLQFVVNQNSSVTKVFDNQLINIMNHAYDDTFAINFIKNKVFRFSTNLDNSSTHSATFIVNEDGEFIINKDGEYIISDLQKNLIVTDREGNICYTIPRIDNASYGNRLRGRWMTVSMTDNDPKEDYAISHILTKFRQSFN